MTLVLATVLGDAAVISADQRTSIGSVTHGCHKLIHLNNYTIGVAGMVAVHQVLQDIVAHEPNDIDIPIPPGELGLLTVRRIMSNIRRVGEHALELFEPRIDTAEGHLPVWSTGMEFLILSRSLSIYHCLPHGEVLMPRQIELPVLNARLAFAAIGSGAQYAMGMLLQYALNPAASSGLQHGQIHDMVSKMVMDCSPAYDAVQYVQHGDEMKQFTRTEPLLLGNIISQGPGPVTLDSAPAANAQEPSNEQSGPVEGAN